MSKIDANKEPLPAALDAAPPTSPLARDSRPGGAATDSETRGIDAASPPQYSRLGLDEKGFPTLELASVAVQTESGNPFHDPFSGQFSFAPPGVNIITGTALLKDIPTPSRKVLFDRVAKSGANQLGAKLIGTQLQIVLLRDGRFLDRFEIKAVEAAKPGKAVKISDIVSIDIIIEAARLLSTTGEGLKSFLVEALGREVSDEELASFSEAVEQQRLTDLISYLDQVLRKKFKGEVSDNSIVRIRAPRGYTRKIFSNLDEQKSREVIQRLSARGWNEDQLQESVISLMPKRLKGTFEKPFKKDTKSVEVKEKDEEKPPAKGKGIRERIRR